MEEFHLTLVAPAGLLKVENTAMVRALGSKRFQTRLRHAVREVLRHYSSLQKVHVRISR
jgi:hypothetical protein